MVWNFIWLISGDICSGRFLDQTMLFDHQMTNNTWQTTDVNFLLVRVSKESKVKRPFFVVVVVVVVVVGCWLFVVFFCCSIVFSAGAVRGILWSWVRALLLPWQFQGAPLGSTMVNHGPGTSKQFANGTQRSRFLSNAMLRYVKNICFGGYHTPSV